MKVITDKVIDQVIDQLDASEENYEKALHQFAEEQPMIMAYLTSESFELLSDDERSYMVYIAVIIYRSYKKSNPNLQDVSEDQIGEAEELNYQELEEAEGADLMEKIETFFEDYEQEELLGLAEEAIMDDEEDEEESVVSEEGAEPVFIGLKTIIDAMMAATP
jgi:hypothetical protein